MAKSGPEPRPTTVEPPDLPRNVASSTPAEDEVADDALFEDRNFENCDVNDRTLRNLVFSSVRLKRFGMQRAKLRNLQLIDARFDLCDVSGADWDRSSLRRVEIVGCRLLGLHASDARFRDVLIQDCNAQYAAFASSSFGDVRFVHCNFDQASFMDADLAGVAFDRCDLSGCDMMGAKLAGADLRGSKIEGLRIGIKEIQGVIVDLGQAAMLLRGLGATVLVE